MSDNDVILAAFHKAKGMDQFRQELSHCPCPKCEGRLEVFLGVVTPKTKKRGMYKGGVYVAHCKECNMAELFPMNKEDFQMNLLCVAFDGGRLDHIERDIPKDYWWG